MAQRHIKNKRNGVAKHMRFREYLNETTKFTKAMQYLHGLKDFGKGLAIFTVMNPMAKEIDRFENKQMFKKLLSLLKSKGKKYIKQKGKYGIVELSVIVIDISIKEVLNISKEKKWKQESFIWFKKDKEKMKSYIIGNGEIIKSKGFSSGKSVQELDNFFSMIGDRKYALKFNEDISIINEGSTKTAYFISPRGELIDTKAGSKHINMIISYPDKFGLTKQFIEDTYEKYNEKMGTEGKARNEIIVLLIKQGWTRIRRYPNKFWIIDIPGKMDKKMKDRLYDFANKMLDGIKGFKEQDKYMPVRIMNLQNYKKEMTIGDIAKDKLFNEEEENINNKRSRYILVEKEIGDI